jgi:hypothetical protein
MVVLVNRFSTGWVDEMHSTACQAIHGFIILLLRLDRLVGDPALHAQAGLGAAEKKCSHCHRIESDQDRNPAVA